MKEVLNVDGLSCSHCENAVKTAVCGMDGVQKMDVDLLNKTVTVEYDESLVNVEDIKTAITNQGYDVL